MIRVGSAVKREHLAHKIISPVSRIGPMQTYGTGYSRDSECTLRFRVRPETIDFPVDFDMAAVRGVPGGKAVASMKGFTYTINLTYHLIATT